VCLIVGFRPSLQAALAEYLLNLEVPVHTAATAVAASDLLKTVRVSTVFYSGSRQAPTMDWLQESLPLGVQRPRLIVLLSRPNVELADRYRELGADTVLTMPVTPGEIVAAAAFRPDQQVRGGTGSVGPPIGAAATATTVIPASPPG
jgi:DNA-binding response OmpR family regulator